jgi:hypothetical protein
MIVPGKDIIYKNYTNLRNLSLDKVKFSVTNHE